MENAAAMMDLEALPEGCIGTVIGLTTPRDACRLSLISKHFKSAAESDAVWDKFLPAETNEILLHAGHAIDAKSKKELYLTLTANCPILIDDGKMSLSLDKWSGKKSYTIAARRLLGAGHLRIDNDPTYWTWKSLPDSRFKEAAEFHGVGILGRIETRMLSPSTTYKAYLVLERMARFPNISRVDGWLEMELGEFHCQGDEDGELEMVFCKIKTTPMQGLLVQGIEIRPCVLRGC